MARLCRNRVVGTKWRTHDIWLRREFSLEEKPSPNTQLMVHHDEAVEVYLNGQKIFSDPGFKIGYAYYTLGDLSHAVFCTGNNILAVHCHNSGGGQYIDAGLKDPGNTPGDELITTCASAESGSGTEWF